MYNLYGIAYTVWAILYSVTIIISFNELKSEIQNNSVRNEVQSSANYFQENQPSEPIEADDSFGSSGGLLRGGTSSSSFANSHVNEDRKFKHFTLKIHDADNHDRHELKVI